MAVSRRIAPLLVAGALGIAPAAAPARTLVEIGGTASPAFVRASSPRPLTLTVDARFRSDVPGDFPGTIKQATISFPRGLRTNGALFPSCDPAALQRAHGRPSACPRGSRLGAGRARGTSPQVVDMFENLGVEVYNGPGGRSLLFFVHGREPLVVRGLIVAPLARVGAGRFGYRLTMPVPHSLQEIARGGFFASLLRFRARVGATVRVRQHGRLVTRGYVEAQACPAGALLPLRGVFAFRGGAHAAADGSIVCG